MKRTVIGSIPLIFIALIFILFAVPLSAQVVRTLDIPSNPQAVQEKNFHATSEFEASSQFLSENLSQAEFSEINSLFHSLIKTEIGSEVSNKILDRIEILISKARLNKLEVRHEFTPEDILLLTRSFILGSGIESIPNELTKINESGEKIYIGYSGAANFNLEHVVAGKSLTPFVMLMLYHARIHGEKLEVAVNEIIEKKSKEMEENSIDKDDPKWIFEIPSRTPLISKMIEIFSIDDVFAQNLNVPSNQCSDKTLCYNTPEGHFQIYYRICTKDPNGDPVIPEPFKNSSKTVELPDGRQVQLQGGNYYSQSNGPDVVEAIGHMMEFFRKELSSNNFKVPNFTKIYLVGLSKGIEGLAHSEDKVEYNVKAIPYATSMKAHRPLPHEYFHTVQFLYGFSGGKRNFPSEFTKSFSESTADFISESLRYKYPYYRYRDEIADSYNKYETDIFYRQYFPLAYGYLAERFTQIHGQICSGCDVIQQLLTNFEMHGWKPEVLRDYLVLKGYSHDQNNFERTAAKFRDDLFFNYFFSFFEDTPSRSSALSSVGAPIFRFGAHLDPNKRWEARTIEENFVRTDGKVCQDKDNAEFRNTANCKTLTTTGNLEYISRKVIKGDCADVHVDADQKLGVPNFLTIALNAGKNSPEKVALTLSLHFVEKYVRGINQYAAADVWIVQSSGPLFDKMSSLSSEFVEDFIAADRYGNFKSNRVLNIRKETLTFTDNKKLITMPIVKNTNSLWFVFKPLNTIFIPEHYKVKAVAMVVDSDADNFSDNADNCPKIANEFQDDFDEDGMGDLCDEDMDNDGIINKMDMCPYDVRNACSTSAKKPDLVISNVHFDQYGTFMMIKNIGNETILNQPFHVNVTLRPDDKASAFSKSFDFIVDKQIHPNQEINVEIGSMKNSSANDGIYYFLIDSKNTIDELNETNNHYKK